MSGRERGLGLPVQGVLAWQTGAAWMERVVEGWEGVQYSPAQRVKEE